MSSTAYCYDCNYFRASNNTETVWCCFLCHGLDCVLCHDLCHVLDCRNSIDSETGSDVAGKVAGIVGKEEVADIADIAVQMVAESVVVGSFVAFVASAA